MKIIHHNLLFILFILSSSSIFGQLPTIDLSLIDKSEFSVENIEWTLDEDGSWTIIEAVAKEYVLTSEKKDLNFGFNTGNHWVRFKISNPLDVSENRILRIHKPLHDSLTLYWKEADKWRWQFSGNAVKESDKTLRGTSNYFEIRLPAHSSQVYYLRDKSKYGKDLTLSIVNEKQYHLIERQELMLSMFLMGALITIALYNVILGFNFKDNVYHFYALFIMCSLLAQMTTRGFLYTYILNDLAFWKLNGPPIFIVFGVASFCLFGIKFLQTKQYSKSAHFMLLGLCLFAIIALCIVFGMNVLLNIWTTNILVAIAALLMGFVGLFSGIIVYRSGNGAAIYFIIAWAVYCISIILYVGTLLTIVPVNSFTINAYVFGSFLEAVLLSLALGYRYRTIRNEKNKLSNDIIDKIKELTFKEEEILLLVTESVDQIRKKENLANNLKLLKAKDESVSVNSILADLRSDTVEDNKALAIKKNIEIVSTHFRTLLKERHSGLTKTDIEICSFIRMDLSRREIATLRNTSIEAIKSSKYRLKKKLGLEGSESLDNYIKNLY